MLRILVSLLKASGIKVAPGCKGVFIQMKDKHELGYAIFGIKEEREIEPYKCSDKHEDKTPRTSERVFNEMRSEVLASGGPCYILFDLSYERKGSAGSKDVVVYIYWCPDSVPIKKKMIYAASNDALKKAFTGIKHFECHDEDEFSYASIAGKLQESDRA